MRILVNTFAGFQAVVTALGAADEILYSSTNPVDVVVAYYASAGHYVLLIPTVGNGPTPTQVTTAYASAVLVAGLKNAEF